MLTARVLRRAAAAATAVLAVGGLAVPRAAVAGSVCWSASTQPASFGSQGDLYGVADISPCNAWAVGYWYDTTSHPLLEHWNGSQWIIKSVPLPVGANGYAYLTAVSAGSASDVWAVGYYDDGSFYAPFTVHFDGQHWTSVPSRNPGSGTTNTYLYGVTVAADGSTWAVGLTGSDPFIEKWSGSKAKWVTQTVPIPISAIGTVPLNAVTATSASNAWAVGNYATSTGQYALVEHWDGTRWKTQSTPHPSTAMFTMKAISASSAKSAFAVGYQYDGATELALIMRWNGTSWAKQTAPNAGGAGVTNHLNGVIALSKSNAWAVGFYDPGTSHTLIEHWDGSGWSKVSSPNLGVNGESGLSAVDANSATDLWAVGYAYDGSTDVPMAVHGG